MLKFNYILLTAALSLFSLCFSTAEDGLVISENLPAQKHQLQNNHLVNACAISVDHSFQEVLNFDEFENDFNSKHFYASTHLNEILFKTHLLYLKICNFLDVSLTIHAIIYPFHSFF